MSKKEDLPSINDYLEDSNLPSYKDFIEEEKELPSVEDYKTYPLEEDQTIEDANGNTFAEVIDVIKAPEWGELVKLVNDVRKEIPQIPEIKSYDEEIAEISEKIAEISENFSQYDVKTDKIYDLKAQNEQFEEKLTEIEQKIPEVPEVRYYEGDIELIYGKISRIKEEIASLPEVKYYENDLDVLKSRIEQVNESIPTFPDWVQKVNEVPDFSWIGKTFGVIDDDFKKVQGHLDIIKERIDLRVSELTETIETKDFEQRVDKKSLSDSLDNTNTKLTETKDKIYKELREMTLRVYDHHNEFKDDDRKLKKALLGEQNKLKKSLKEQIDTIEKESIKTDEKIISFYTDLREEVEQKFNSLPEVKYYDKDIDKLQVEVKNVKTNIKGLITELYKIATVIKKQQKTLSEGLLNEPPSEKETAGGQSDPLTPMDQKFATLEDLSKHYRLFINRIQTQLSTMGGGGAGFIRDLDDVTFEGINDQLLIYNSATSKWVGIASTAIQGSVGAGGTWATDAVGIHTVKSVGIGTTARSGYSLYVEGNQYVDGNITVGGTITYEDVKNVDSLGIITGRDNINIINDNKKLNIGASADLQLYHSVVGGGQTSFIDNNTGPLYIRNNVDDDDGGNIIIQAKSGKSSAVFQDDEGVRLYYNDVEKFETTDSGINVSGATTTTTLEVTSFSTFNGNVKLFDGKYLNLGNSNDLQIVHDGGNAVIQNATGAFFIDNNSTGGDIFLRANDDVIIRVDGNDTVLTAQTGGIDVTGHTETDTLNVSGIATVSTGVGTVHIGTGNTTLLVDGDARVLGILTVGSASVTIDGTNNKVSVGLVTVTNSTIILGDNVTLDAGATGINSAPNVFYVAKDGNDSNNGTSIDNAKLTIAGAVSIANTGSVIKVLSGNYVENNPIELPAFSAVVGDDLRTVKVLPSNTTQDLFHVKKGCKLANMTFSGHLHPAAAVAFPPTGATNVGGGKWKGPYIQNCTSDTTTGTGIRVDGRLAPKTKSMNVDAFTQYNQGGVGVAVTNEGYAQLVSVFTICCNSAIQCHSGGQADIANSNCSFGTFGLVSNGKSVEKYRGSVTTSAAVSQDNVIVNIAQTSRNINNFVYTPSTGIATVTTTAPHGFVAGSDVRLADITLNCTDGNKVYPDKDFIYTVRDVGSTTSFTVHAGIHTQAHTYVSGGTAILEGVRPYDGQIVYFDELYRSVESITITNGGSGYTSTPSVTIASPTGPNGETATAFATIEGGVVTSIDIISSGSQYKQTDTATITITAPDSGTTATATAVMEDTYYTINSSTPVSSGISTLTLAENLLNTVGVASTAYFYQQSKIVASSHTFEYIGAGDQITGATPKRGGVTIQANEVVSENGGRVIYTSTDQAGNFRIGDDLQINQATGTISGRAFSKSLFSEMTPFILALS